MKIWMAIPIGVTLLLAQGHSVSAQTTQDFVAACQADITKHCGPLASTPAGLQACMMANRDKLGDACKKQMDAKR